MTMPSILSKPNLIAFLREVGIDDSKAYVLVPDDEYMLPTYEWVINTFSNALWKRQRVLKLHSYVKGKNNCNKFSRHAAQFAAECHAKTKAGKTGTSLAFGEVAYVRDDGRGHMLNLAFFRDKDERLNVFWFEPQTCKEVTLTKTEIANIEYVRI